MGRRRISNDEDLMKSLFLVCFVWLGIVGYGQTAPQYPNTHYLGEYNNYYYYSSKTKHSWDESRKEVRKIDSSFTLLSIHSLEENDWVVNRLWYRDNRVYHYYWLGGTDQDEEGVFVWDDETTFDFFNWADNEPNNSYDIGEHWIMLNYGGMGKWNDATNTGSDTFQYVFKVPKIEQKKEEEYLVYPNLINYYSNNTLTISVPRTDIDKEILIRLSDGQGKTVLFKTAIVISQKIYLELPLLSQAPYYGVIVGSENTHKFKIIYQN